MKPKEFFEKLDAEGMKGILEFIDGPVDPSIRVEPADLPRILAFLKDDPDCRLDQLSLVSGVEYEDRFECVYHLLSTVRMHDLVIKAHLDKDAPCVPTVSDVHPTANWHERETWDLVGIRFEGHPDPRRIYLPADWEGHPLQRDYVFPNEFNGLPLTDQHGPVKQAEEGPSETAQS